MDLSNQMTVSINQNADSKEYLHLKLNFKENYELNILLTKSELNYIIENIKSAVWSEQQSIKMGKSAGVNVFWTYEAGVDKISILIGQDDETWGIGFFLPFGIMDRIENILRS